MSLVTAEGQPIQRVMIAVPCGDAVAAGFAQDLALLMGYTTFVKPELEVSLYFLKGTYLPRARATLARNALTRGATHILWVDADMRFPKDALLRLLSHGQPIVAANYPTRQPPILPTALDMNLEHIFVHDDEPLMDVRACGMGLMLTDVTVFAQMAKPWFAVGYNRTTDDYAGEDTFFCDKARTLGYHVWIDGALSAQTMHVGSFEFRAEHARMTLAAAKGE